jgi:hypothetical protein
MDYPNGLGVIYKDIAPHQNLLFSVDGAASRSGEFKNMRGEDYVRNYWKQYPGILSGLESIETITNSNNETGYKAVYTLTNKIPSPAIDIFFELSTDSADLLHFSNGALDDTVFNTIVASFKKTR